MTGPVPQDDHLAGLAAEVGELSQRLAAVQASLLALRAETGPAPAGQPSDPAPDPAPEAAARPAPPTGSWPAGTGQPPGPAGPWPAPPGQWPVPQWPVPQWPVPQWPVPQWPVPPGQWSPGQWSPPGGQPWAGPGDDPPPGYPPPGHPPPGHPAPGGYPGQGPSAPSQQPGSGPPPWPGSAPPPGSTPRPHPGPSDRSFPRQREGLGPQLVAWAGGTITLLGIVLLLVLAASRGWLQPGARVVGGALLSAALIGVAGWVYRRPGGRTGAVALAATGVAGLYLDVVAATALYEYLPVVGGLAVAVLVAGGGLALADRWTSQPLAVGAVVGAAVLAPVLIETGDAPQPLLAGLAVVLQLAAVPVVLRRRWTVLAAVAAGWSLLYGLLAVDWAADTGRHAPATAAVVAVLLVGAGVAVGAGRLPVALRCAQLVAATMPVLAMALVLDRTAGALTAAAVAAGLFAVAAPSLRSPSGQPVPSGPSAVSGWPVPGELRAVAVVVGAVAGFEATMIALRGGTQTVVLLGEALALAVAAILLRRRSVLVAAAGFGAVGTALAVFRDAPLRALLTFPARPYVVGGAADRAALATGAGTALLVLAAAVVALAAAHRVGWLRSQGDSAPLWVAAAAVVLYGAAGLLVALALLVTPTRSGFLAGHVLVTVSWTVAALGLLVRGIRQQALRVAGGALVIAAVAKLVLFDLSQLDGLARVLAFLCAGIVLLAAGTRYARLVATAQREQAGQPGQPGPPGQGQSFNSP